MCGAGVRAWARARAPGAGAAGVEARCVCGEGGGSPPFLTN